MQIIGLTGGIATGKTSAATHLAQHGIPVIDADQLAHKALMPGTNAYAQVCKLFPNSVDPVSGQLDRQLLGDIVFKDKTLRKKLEQIIHPIVRRGIFKALFWNWLRGTERVILDVPLLFETGLDRWVSYSIVVAASNEIQQFRIMSRNSFTASQAKLRIEAQMPVEEKCRRADVVIYNEKDFQALHNQLHHNIIEGRRQPNFFLHRVLLYAIPLVSLSGATLWIVHKLLQTNFITYK